MYIDKHISELSACLMSHVRHKPSQEKNIKEIKNHITELRQHNIHITNKFINNLIKDKMEAFWFLDLTYMQQFWRFDRMRIKSHKLISATQTTTSEHTYINQDIFYCVSDAIQYPRIPHHTHNKQTNNINYYLDAVVVDVMHDIEDRKEKTMIDEWIYKEKLFLMLYAGYRMQKNRKQIRNIEIENKTNEFIKNLE